METTLDETLIDLLQATARGDSKAFKRLYDETSPHLYAIALKMMREKALAEDVLQDAFVQIWHRARDYHTDRGAVLTWMTTIVRYRAIDLMRKRRTGGGRERLTPIDPDDAELDFPEAADTADADGSSPLSSAIANEDSRRLERCMKRLSEEQKRSVALAFFHGLTHRELSECLAEPLGTIKSRLRRSLARLKECLTNLGEPHEISGRAG